MWRIVNSILCAGGSRGGRRRAAHMASLAVPAGWRHEAARAARWRVYGEGPNVDGHDAEEQKQMDWDSPHASLRCMKG